MKEQTKGRLFNVGVAGAFGAEAFLMSHDIKTFVAATIVGALLGKGLRVLNHAITPEDHPFIGKVGDPMAPLIWQQTSTGREVAHRRDSDGEIFATIYRHPKTY